MLKETKTLETSLQNQSNKLVRVEVELGSFKVDLEEARIDGFHFGDQGFKKAKERVSCLYFDLYLRELDYYKMVVEVCLVEETDLVAGQPLEEDMERTSLPKRWFLVTRVLERRELLQQRSLMGCSPQLG